MKKFSVIANGAYLWVRYNGHGWGFRIVRTRKAPRIFRKMGFPIWFGYRMSILKPVSGFLRNSSLVKGKRK